MTKNIFSTELISEDDKVISSYIGRNVQTALSVNTQQFRDLVTMKGTKTIETRINGEDVKFFDLILKDFYL